MLQNQPSKKILIIDDDQKLCSLLSRFLKERGFEVDSAQNGKDGVDHFRRFKHDLLLLDVMMPGKDGFEILREIRSFSDVPVIMLTARGDTTDRVVGLQMGADDYIPKPFETIEIEARIKAVLRRGEKSAGIKNKIINIGRTRIDTARRCVISESEEQDLTASEFRLLEYFLLNPNQLLSREQITEFLYGEDFDSFRRTVDILISRLRKKLGDDPKKPAIIKTLHGHGYMFMESGDEN